MKIGDIVECDGQRWRVYKEDKHVKTLTLLRWGGATEEVATDDPRLKFACDPSQWPFVTARVNLRAGPLVDVILSRRNRPRSLIPYVDWVPSDQSRAGGALFLGPHLRLRLGEILVAVHSNGPRVRLSITKEFGTMTSRRNRRSALPERRDLVDYLDGEDFVVE